MTGERWKQVRAIFEAALERPRDERAAFIASAAAGDGELQREVESLLAADAVDSSVLDHVSSARAGMLANIAAGGQAFGPGMSGHDSANASDDRRRLPSHSQLGSYEILAMIGAGAMGEVYRARDTKLNRDVAIKVLPSQLASDPSRLARLKREAQMLAALNHPNIAAIYGFEDSSEVPALVLELVDGSTLADRIAGGALPFDEAIALASQICDAMEAAHDKGIVHRDLKPANIKIATDGTVKVLDFGLAKGIISDNERSDLTGSHAGLIIGTASYLSPEQARGLNVDRRSDIWAFGCVLYEMLTGRLAFPGATVSDTIAKILEREPDWSALPEATPPHIRRLLFRCLTKHSKRRLKDIGDVKLELEIGGEAIDGVVAERTAGASRAPWRNGSLPIVAGVALAAGIGLSEVIRRPATEVSAPTEVSPMTSARFSRLTEWASREGGADISPDGRFVVFASDRAGEFDVWSSQIGTGDFTNLTATFPSVGAPHRLIRSFGFVGDGSEIWFSASNDPVLSRKMRVPLTGGTPRPFLAEGEAAPAWSADGTRLVLFKNALNDALFVADRDAGDAKQIPIDPSELQTSGAERIHRHNMVWSPDDQWLYFVHGSTRALDWTDEMDVWRVRSSGGTPERLTHHNAAVTFLAPLDARTLLFVARGPDGSGPWLWSLDTDRKVTRRATWGLEPYTSVAASRDGRRVVATVISPTANLWRVPILNRVATDRDVQQYELPTVRALAPRFRGNALFYLSSRGTADGLWRFQDGQAIELRKGVDGAMFDAPAVSRDARQVAVVHVKERRRRLAIMEADGTAFHGLAESLDIQGTIDWSPDGEWIVAGAIDETQKPGLFKIPVRGGAPIRLADGQASNPVWSADAELIVYAGALVTGQVAPLIAIRPDGARVDLPALQVRPGGFRLLPDGKGLVYLPQDPSLDFWLLDFANRRSRQLTHLQQLGTRGTFDISPVFDITPDGKQIVFDRAREDSDIVLIELAKGTRP